MPNTTFQLKRFFETVKETLRNKKITFVIMLLIVAVLPLFVLFITKLEVYRRPYFLNRDLYRRIFTLFTILAPYLFFFNVDRVKKGVVQPMRQASALEKFLNMSLFCFVLVPLSVAVVYGVSHHLFASFYPEYLHKFTQIDLQHLFLGKLFTPVLILLMQTTFFFNLLYREKKVRRTILTFVVALFIYILLDSYFFLWMGLPPFLHGPLLYILPIVLLISSYFLLKRKDIQVEPRCETCGAKLKGDKKRYFTV